MAGRLVLVGAGHAHLAVLRHLEDFTSRGVRVTVVGPAAEHYYSGMGPGLLAGTYRPEETRFPVRDMALRRGAEFRADRVVGVEPDARRLKLAGGGTLPYDAVSFNVGSLVPVAPDLAGHGALFPVKPIENLIAARRAIEARLAAGETAVAVAGGGPAGLEIACAVRALARRAGREAAVALAAGGGLLPGFPARLQRAARAALAARRIRLLEGERLLAARGEEAVLASGGRISCAVLLLAVGVRPPPLFGDSGLPTDAEGALCVNRFLQSPSHPEIFGGGDCIHFSPRPLSRVGVYAVRQNPVLLANLRAFFFGGEPVAFRPQRHFLLAFNLGDGRALVHWRGLVFGGRAAFRLKDRLDRGFLRRFRD
ncbi:MAG: FAD-dependent oxidoreductase [Desulfobacterales bacterium]